MAAEIADSRSARFALRCSNWAERWFPDSWVFAAVAVITVALATMFMGAKPTDAAMAFGDGFWSLIPFTMQMAFVVIGGYVVASSPPAVKLIDKLAQVPKNGRQAVCWVALISMVASLLNWGLSLVFGGLLVRALARRTNLRMDYRAAGAAAYRGLGAHKQGGQCHCDHRNCGEHPRVGEPALGKVRAAKGKAGRTAVCNLGGHGKYLGFL